MNFRKKCSICMALVCLFAVNTFSAIASTVAVVAVDGANIRSGPSTTKQVLISAKIGEELKVSDKIEDWYKVAYDGVIGYIREDKVNLRQTSEILYVSHNYVNLRESSNTNSDVLKVLHHGDELALISKQGNWYKVKSGSVSGYIHSSMTSTKMPDNANAENGTMAGIEVLNSDEPGETETSSAADQVEIVYSDLEALKVPETKSGTVSSEQEKKLTDDLIVLSDIPEESSISTRTSSRTSSITSMSTKEMQSILSELGFYTGDEDGVMGTWSQAALKAFQRAYGLEVDGQLGADSVKSLIQAKGTGGNGFSAKKVQSSNGVVLAEWFNYMKKAFPKYVALKCVDVQTGKSFKLRAFSCGNHADVEPPTKEDTQKLYSINGNKWSWTPRPIWVYIDGVPYAAAINVQPHGPDTLPDNGMSGQICMHFLHSRTHNTGTENANLQKALMLAFESASKAAKPN